MVTVDSQAAGSAVSLSDSSGNELVSWTPEKEYNSVIISCPEITTGQEYTLTTGSDTTQITMDSIVYGSGSGMGGNPGNGGGPGTVEIWDRNQMTAMERAKARETAETWERLRKKVNNYNKEGR